MHLRRCPRLPSRPFPPLGPGLKKCALALAAFLACGLAPHALAQTEISTNTTLSTTTTLSSPTTVNGATLTVDSGAAVDTVTFRLGGTSAGNLVVDGTGTSFTATQFYLGDDAPGSITLSNNATLNAGSFLVSTVGGPFATTLNFGAAANQAAAVAGVFSPTALTVGTGADFTVQFNTLSDDTTPLHVTSTGLEGGAAINLSGPAHLIHTAGSTYFSGSIAANSRLTTKGGSLSLTGTLGDGADIVVNGGYLSLPSHEVSVTSIHLTNGTLWLDHQTTAADVVIDGGSLQGGFLIADSLTMSAGELTTNATGDFQFVKTGPGDAYVESELTPTGGTLVSDGTLVLLDDSLIDHSGADFAIAPTGTAFVQNTSYINAANVLLGQSGGTATLELSQSGALRTGSIQSGSSTSTLAIEGGTLIASGDHSNFISGFDSDALELYGEGVRFETDYTVATSAIFNGKGGFTKSGSGTLTLSGNQAYTGETSIDGGTLRLTGTTASSRFNLNEGTLDLNGQHLTFTEVGVGNGTLVNGTITATDLYARGGTFSPGVTLSGTLIKEWSDTFTINTAQTYTGGTILRAGLLHVSADNHLGHATGGITLEGGFLSTATSFTTNRAVTFSEGASGGFSVDHGATLTLSGAITNTGYGFLDKLSGGTLLTNTANTFTGTITVVNGTMAVGSGGSFDLGANGVVSAQYTGGVDAPVNHATFTITGGTVTTDQAFAGRNHSSGVITVASGSLTSTNLIDLGPTGHGTLVINGGTVTTAAIDVGRSGFGTGIIALNGGTLTTTQIARWSFSSEISFNGGILRAASDAPTILNGFSAGSAVINAGGLTIDSNNFTVASPAELTGSGGLTKTGTGSLTLTGTNAYTGTTTVAAGTLALGASSSLAQTSAIRVGSGASFDVSAVTGGFTLNAGQTVTGSGTIIGSLALASGAILAPGNSPGTLTFSDGLTLNSGAIFNFELGAISDLIAVTGGLLTGPASGTVTLNFANSGGFTAGNYTLINYATASGTAGFGAEDFTFGTTIPGYTYSLALAGSTLQLTATAAAIPEPSTYAAIFGALAMALALYRRRRP